MHDQFRHEDGPDGATRSLVISGEIDAAAAASIRERVEQALGAGKRRVIVDLSDVSFMESAAMAALLDANARVRRSGASMWLVIPRESRVRHLFSITRLDRVLPVMETREQALEAP
jgi:anti-sigma B factor antagonist